MVYKCSVPKCTSGYDGIKPSASGISMHQFPSSDNSLYDKWIKAINRDKFTPTKRSRVCSLHFSDHDFKDSSEDSNKSRRRSKSEMSRRQLKPLTVPSIFMGQPSYFTTPKPPPRSAAASSDQRTINENTVISNLEQSMYESDLVDTIGDFADLKLPSGFHMIRLDNASLLYIFLDQSIEIPKIVASFNVYNDLSFKITFLDGQVNSSKLNNLLKQNCKISSKTELCNCLAEIKSWCEHSSSTTLDIHIESAVNIIEHIITNNSNEINTDLCTFLKEQLQLMNTFTMARRYSPSTIISSFLWHMTSPSLYRLLSNFFNLPSVRRLQQLSAGVNVNANVVDRQYLRKRTQILQDYEKVMFLLMDEIYTASRVEYCNGEFIGLTDDGKVAKTILAFMIQSLTSSYNDVVCVIPIEKLTTEKMIHYYKRVISELRDLVFIQGLSVDNSAVNR